MGEIKPGTYKGRAMRGQSMRTDQGTTYIGLEMRIFDGETAIGELPASLWTTKENMVARTKRSLELLGWRGEIDDDGWMVGFPNLVPIGVVDEEYKGRVTTKIDWVGEPPFSGGLNDKHKLQLSDAKKAAAAFAREMGLTPKVAGGQQNERQQQCPPQNGTRPIQRESYPYPEDRTDANEDF